jgi:hypothetical protein
LRRGLSQSRCRQLDPYLLLKIPTPIVKRWVLKQRVPQKHP